MSRSSREIIETLALLKQHDAEFKLFGAGGQHGHAYELHRVTVAEIEVLEGKMETPLPADFSRHLLEVGWGAGPWYGVQAPEAMGYFFTDDWEPAASRGRPALSFPVTAGELGRYFQNPLKERFTFEDEPSGVLRIGHEGDGCFSVLVTAGELAETVWSDLTRNKYCPQWYPMTAKGPGVKGGPILRLVTFAEWYDLWLDNCLAALALRLEPS